MAPAGFPHSETRGSKAVSASPRLIAAGRVLLRLPVPRHPPRAHGILAPHRGLELVFSDHGRISAMRHKLMNALIKVLSIT